MVLFRFFADRRGGVAPMFALALVPIMGMVGAAIDYSRAGAARTAMQAALDATALTIAKDWQTLQPSQITPRATDLFNAVFAKAEVQGLQVTATVTNGPTGTTVSTSATG